MVILSETESESASKQANDENLLCSTYSSLYLLIDTKCGRQEKTEQKTQMVFFFCLQICGLCKKSKQGTIYENSGFLMTVSSQLLLYFTSFFTLIGVRNKHDEKKNIRVKTDKWTKYCALLMSDKRNSRIYDFDFYFSLSLFLYFYVLFFLLFFAILILSVRHFLGAWAFIFLWYPLPIFKMISISHYGWFHACDWFQNVSPFKGQNVFFFVFFFNSSKDHNQMCALISFSLIAF